jgi:hypothetical protein
LRSTEAPRYRRPPRPWKLDPFREEVHRLLRCEPRLPGKRVRELLEEQGYVGGKTILDDYLREVRPLFLPRRDAGLGREGALHAGGGRPTDVYAAFCGELGVGWRFLEARDPQSKGVVERLQGYAEASFEPGRAFANELDFQEQLDRWFDERANVRFHRTLRCRPADRLAEELTVMRPLPERLPDARALRELRGASPEPEVQTRPLQVYDALIPA